MSLYLGQPRRILYYSRPLAIDVVLDTKDPWNVVLVPQFPPDPWAAYRAVRRAASEANRD